MLHYFVILFSILFIYYSHSEILVLNSNTTYLDRLAVFGPRIYYPGLKGRLVLYESLHPHGNPKGCQVVKAPFEEPWIALVERGSCSFIEKVRALQKSNASAVIVGDDMAFGGLVTMKSDQDTSDVDIPSVFITNWEYKALKYLITDSQTFLHNLETNLLDPFTYDNEEDQMEAFLFGQMKLMFGLLFGDIPFIEIILLPNPMFGGFPLSDIILLTVIAPLIMILFVCSLYRYRRHLVQMSGATTIESIAQSDPNTLVATPSMVQSLPTFLYHWKSRKLNDPETCAICLEDFQDGENLRILPCHHHFHMHCIDPWFLCRKRTCPICKANAFSFYSLVPLTSRSLSPSVAYSFIDSLYTTAPSTVVDIEEDSQSVSEGSELPSDHSHDDGSPDDHLFRSGSLNRVGNSSQPNEKSSLLNNEKS